MSRSLHCPQALSAQLPLLRRPTNVVGEAGTILQPRRHETRSVKRLISASYVKSRSADNGTHCAETRDTNFEHRRNRRVLLKISGEALQGRERIGIDPEVIRSVCREIAEGRGDGIQIAVVVGGGNFFRGERAFEGLDRATADYVGMLATTMNAVCLQAVLENFGVQTRLQTAMEIREVAEPYIRRRAIGHLQKGRVVIFGAGTGNPFFTTDMAAALRAAEIDADEILKATKVDGVYSSDPTRNPQAQLLTTVTYDYALTERLRFMDTTALALCRDQSIPVRVFSLFVTGNISKAIRGEPVGTIMGHAEITVNGTTKIMNHRFHNIH